MWVDGWEYGCCVPEEGPKAGQWAGRSVDYGANKAFAGIAADSSAAVVEPLVAEGVSGVEEDESEQVGTGFAGGGEIIEDRR